MKRLNKDKPVVVYCVAGGRSAQTGEVLKNLGFNEVYEQSARENWSLG